MTLPNSERLNIDRSRSRLILFAAGLVTLILSLILLEFTSAVYFEFFSPYYYRPLYLRDYSNWWWTELEPWGAWHKPNAEVFHRSSCFAVNYKSNSIGARDVERASPGAANSAIFLGDSFVEGWGVRDQERLSNVFEQRTGKASINLGVARDVGPLQYWMLYDAFARRFSHDTVIIGFLPANDFTDNDPEFEGWQEESYRYRPYYKKTTSGYDIFHKGTFEIGRTFRDYSTQRIAGKSALLHYTWTGGFLFLKRNQLPPLSDADISQDVSNRGYFETSRDRLEAAYYFFETLIRNASPAKVYILIIPRYSEAKELRVRSSPWLSEFVAKFQSARVSIIDLGPVYAGLSDDLLRRAFLKCDPHWSALGNAIAANALLKAFIVGGPAGGQSRKLPDATQ